jgi:hypothetical protein
MNRNLLLSVKFFLLLLVSFSLLVVSCNQRAKTGGEGTGEFEASGNLDQMSRIKSLCPPGFQLISGDDSLTLPVLFTPISGGDNSDNFIIMADNKIKIVLDEKEQEAQTQVEVKKPEPQKEIPKHSFFRG